MEEVSTFDPLIILREKGRGGSPSNLLIGADVYDTVRTRNVLPLHQIKTVEREMKRRRTTCITNTPGKDDGCRLKPDSSSVIYMTSVKEAQCHIVSENRRKNMR